ncbi:hypothetical protein BGZ76_004527, partial [Entomortierella beljakovae]
EFAIKDTHKHPDFNKMFSCFLGYVGRQRSNGISDASSKPNVEQCRKEYDEMLLQGSISITHTTACNVVNHAIQNHGTRKINNIYCEQLNGIINKHFEPAHGISKHPDPVNNINKHPEPDNSSISKHHTTEHNVAMSGIVNARMDGARKVFGEKTIEKVKDLCFRPYICNPSQKLLDILVPLQEAHRSGGLDELLYKVEEGLGIEAKERRENRSHDQLKGRIMDAVRHIAIKSPSKNMSEAELVSVWSYVINALAGHKLTLRSGELTVTNDRARAGQ